MTSMDGKIALPPSAFRLIAAEAQAKRADPMNSGSSYNFIEAHQLGHLPTLVTALHFGWLLIPGTLVDPFHLPS